MNLYAQFHRLLPKDPLWVGRVLSHNSDNSSSVQLPGGAVIRVQGQTVAINSNAFVQSGRMHGPAPDLPIIQVLV